MFPLGTPLTDLPGVSWVWAPSSLYLNGTYGPLDLDTTYFVDLTGRSFVDQVSNGLSGDMFKNFTTDPGTTATVTGPTGGPTNVAGINIQYSISGSPSNAQLWYTTDTSFPYIWISIGIDNPADGNYSWTVPSDGSFGWFANTTDDPPPGPTDAPEASYYIYDGTAPSISSTTPTDGATGISSVAGTFIIEFDEPMALLGTPLSDLPGVSWVWAPSGLWLNGSYTVLSLSTTYYVDLTGQDFQDIAGNGLSGDIYLDFTVGSESIPPTINSATPTGTGVLNNSNIVIIFNEAMNTNSVENAFSYTDGTSTWDISSGAVTWSVSDDQMTFNPTTDFE
jgi:hypothetical protein